MKLIPGLAGNDKPGFFAPDVHVLRDEHGCIRYYLKPGDVSEYTASFYIHEVDGWYLPPHDTQPPYTDDEIGTISLKWDGCSHLGLRDPELNKEWVHVHGPDHFEQTMRALAWAWRVAQDSIKKYMPEQRLTETVCSL